MWVTPSLLRDCLARRSAVPKAVHVDPRHMWCRRQSLSVNVGLRDADDAKIFVAARKAGAVVLTKDEDFVTLVSRLGSPPAVVWLTCGNVPNRQLKKILHAALPDALALIQRGEPVVEISRGEPPARRRRPRSTRRRGSARPE